MTALVSSDIFTNFAVWFTVVPFIAAMCANMFFDEKDEMRLLYRIICHGIAMLVSGYLASEAMALSIWDVNVQNDVSTLGLILWVWAGVNLVMGVVAFVQLIRDAYEESDNG